MKIVLTGGPGAGKSTICALLAAREPRIVTAPEAAAMVYGRLGLRWDQIDNARRREVQQEIYRTQCQQEAQLAAEHPGKSLLLDRGVVDGASYWPDGADDYWQALGTTAEAALARNDMVIWLETAAILGIYDGPASNPVRTEDTAAAVERGMRVAEAWSRHKNLHRVGAYHNFNDKLQSAALLIEAALEEKNEVGTADER